jgi:hypothetical protein
VVFLAGTALPAAASSRDTSDEAVEAVIAAEMTIVSDAVAPELSGDETAYEASANGVHVELPVDPSRAITLVDERSVIRITLPAADAAGPLTETESGLLAYDHRNDSQTVPVFGEDGSLQVNTVISSADAPKAFEYELAFSEDVSVQSGDGGTLLFFDSEGALILFIAKPWATDAAGRDVPTHYEYAGHVLTQVVEHDSEFTYPVVADPWLGTQLFFQWAKGTWSGDVTYSAWVTPSAVVAAGGISYLIWRAVMASEGWNEWKAKWPAVTNKATLWQQFDCHAAAGIFGLPFTQAYNLERARFNRTNGDWLPGLAYHHCNWNSAGGV